FPPETRDYVPMVIAAAWLYLHPRRYGLEFAKVRARPELLTLERPASIYELTICLGNGGTRYGFMRMLRNLNPRYQPDEVIPAGTAITATSDVARLYGRWCTSSARADIARELVNSNPESAIVRSTPAPTPSGPRRPAVPREHRVARGETLDRIAQRYGCGLHALARANNLRAPAYSVRVGQRLSLAPCGD